MEQRLIQSPQMIQAMQILQLPLAALEERIDQELLENPFLEREEGNGEQGSENSEGDSNGDPIEHRDPHAELIENKSEGNGVEGMLDVLERYEKDFGDGTSGPRTYDGEDGDRKFEAMQNAPDLPQTLAESLSEEMLFTDLDERGRALAEFLLYSLDERGYLPDPLEELAEDAALEFDPPPTIEELQQILVSIRAVSHAALGARDLQEALMLQLQAAKITSPLVHSLITEHLEDVENNRLPRIAKTTGRSMEEVKDAIEMLRQLDPIPGANYGGEQAATITPEVVIEEVDGEYEVRSDGRRAPRLKVSGIYRDMLKRAERGDGTREWVRKRLENARWFIDALAQRESTLHRIASSIFVHQKPFLEKGMSALRPLRMQEVADEIGVHISTVSRGVSGKYAQTPRGIFPLKFFFTGGTEKEDGEVASQVSIKQRIGQLVEGEDKAKPLSDDALAAELLERFGIKIARRTVTKYRKALGLPSSSQRREF